MNKNKKKTYELFCTGCGLCHSVNGTSYKRNGKGFMIPHIDEDKISFYDAICPASGKGLENLGGETIWGKYKKVYSGYAADKEIRYKASSGGVITGAACYLLKSKLVDAIIHTGFEEGNPLKTVTFCSETEEEVLSHCGSRYCTSSPLIDIKQILSEEKKYAYIGKPCEITALKNLAKSEPKINEQIIYFISFFCMGAPSIEININLIESLGCSYKDCNSLQYRGNGWPGYTTAIDNEGKSYATDYHSAWSMIGKDVMPYCRYCMDGVGESADISCGDVWYLNENNDPDFSEREGMNVVFGRTDKGAEVLEAARKDNYLVLSDYEKRLSDLDKLQKSQHNRRTTMIDRILAAKLFFRPTPYYNKKILSKYLKYQTPKHHIKTFLGMIRRILQGRA